MNFLTFTSPLKRFYKFLLKRVLGSFLQYELDLNQLDVQLAKGEVILRDLELNVQMLNDLCVDLPITFIRARIRYVKATIPWRNLLTQNCMLKLDGWELVIVPSEQVQQKSSGTFSTLLAQSLLSDIDPRDVALQASLASLGQHFRPETDQSNSSSNSNRRASGGATPSSMAASASAFGSPAKPSRPVRAAREAEEERRHEATTFSAARERERKRKIQEERRRRQEELGEDSTDDDLDGGDGPAASGGDTDVDDDLAEEARAKRAHSARQAAAIDTANEGLKVVASFLEQVVSAIELEVTDVTLRVQHQPKVGTKQTTLLVKLPWVHFSDLNKEAKDASEQRAADERREAEQRAADRAARREAIRLARESDRAERLARGEPIDDDADSRAHEDDADAEAEAEAEASIRRAIEARLARDRDSDSRVDGPKYEYHKSIKFHGFRVELHEEAAIDTSFAQFPASASTKPAPLSEVGLDDSGSTADSEPQTIISGSMDQTCIITLKLKMTDTAPDQPKLESTCFIQSLRALLTPRQLALLSDLASAIGLSAKQVALNAQLTHASAMLQQPAPPMPNAAGGFSPCIQQPQPAYAPAANASNQRHKPHTQQPPAHDNNRTSDPSYTQPRSSPDDTPPGESQSIHMWSMETHILNCSLTLTETDEQTWSTDWWLDHATATAAKQTDAPNAIVQSVIPGIQSNHLYLASHHTFININQTSLESTVKVTLGSVQLDEYLLQSRADPSAAQLDPNEFIGFRARPLVSFLTPTQLPNPSDLHYPPTNTDTFTESTRTVAAPHLSLEFRNTVDQSATLTFNEPPALFFDPHTDATINSRMTLACQPATLDVDLGIGSRLHHLLDAVSAPTAYLNADSMQPPTSTSEEANSFTFDTNRPTHVHTDAIISDMPVGQRRPSVHEPSSYAQTVIIAPNIKLNILFPVDTPSQRQPHPYTPLTSLTGDPYTDARGILRPERISVELSEVSLANEVDLTSIPPVTDPLINPALLIDAEWIIRFHQAQVFMHYPNSNQRNTQTEANSTLIKQRILTTSYPTDHYPSASSAYLRHAALASYISILTKASIVPGAPLPRSNLSEFGDGPPHSPSSSSEHAQQEYMFFDGLPNVKHWESATLNGERKRVFRTSTTDTYDDAEHTIGQPDAAIFEALALRNSGLVVTIHLPVAALHLAKYDYDLLMFLYTIFSEVMEPHPPIDEPALVALVDNDDARITASAFDPDGVPASMSDSALSSQEEHDQVDVHGLVRSVHFSRHPAASYHPDGDDDELDLSHADEPLSHSDSSDSDSSSEMFESVGGADSVILRRQPYAHNSMHRSRHGHSSNSFMQSAAAAAPFGTKSLVKSNLAANESNSDDSHLARQIKQFYLQRQPLTWVELKRIIIGIPHGMQGTPQQESFIQIEHALSAWIRGVDRQLPIRWQPYRQRMHALFGSIDLTPLHLSSIDPEHDDDSGGAPLTMDSSIVMGREESKSDDDDDMQFEPTVRSSPSGSPRDSPRHDFDGHLESNLSDVDSDASMPGEVESELIDSQATIDQDEDHRRNAFGARSTIFASSPVDLDASGAHAAEADDADTPGVDDASEASNSQAAINTVDVFARASRASGQSQLFQPAMCLSSVLPPVDELASTAVLPPLRYTPAMVASTNYGMQSSMMDSITNPDMFESFLPAPPGTFDPHASINPDLSIDYSHLPPPVIAAKLAQSQPTQPTPPGPAILPPLDQTLASSLESLRIDTARRPINASAAVRSSMRQPPAATPIVAPPMPSPYKHFMSLRLSIGRASLVIQDDPLDASVDASAIAASSSSSAASSPQTFHIDIGEVQLFQVAEFDGKPVTYIAIRAGDLTVREYHAAVTEERGLFITPSMPILFKTTSEEQTATQQNAPSDPLGRTFENDYKHGVSDSAPVSASPLSSVFGGSSVAWSNPVLLINVVMKLKPHLQLRDTQAVINLRALTLQYFPESQWIQKLMVFFTPTVYVPPVMPPTFNVAPIQPPPPLPVTKELLHIFLHGYDVSIDYNPTGIQPRAVVSVDHVHLQTTVYPDTAVSTIKLEVRDLAMYMIPRSPKAAYAPTATLTELGSLFLHRIPAASLFAHLESIGYAQLVTLDFLDVAITQNTPTAAVPVVQQKHIPGLSVDVTNGILTLLTCSDSFQIFTEVCAHFVASIQEIQQVAEIDVRFDGEESHSVDAVRRPAASYQITNSAPLNTQTSGGFTAKAFSTNHRPPYLLDDDEEEDDDGNGRPIDAARSVGSVEPRNILDQLDHNAFGADLGVAQVYTADQSIEMKFNENYHDERHRQTAISLALQAAAEREIARARREHEDQISVDESSALRRSNSSSPPRLNPADGAQPAAVSGVASDHAARWLSVREIDDLVEKDKHEKFLATLPDDESRMREEELAREREERRRRREEREKESDRRMRDAKDQRVTPQVIDDHVPLADDDTRTGRARFKPPADYPQSVSELLLLNLTVCWRMFGGRDWDDTLAPPTAATERDRSAPHDEPQVNNSAMSTVNLIDFYGHPEPFLKPAGPFSSSASSSFGGRSVLSVPVAAGSSSFSPATSDVPVCDTVVRGYRQTDRVMELLIKGANVRFDQYPTNTQVASRVVIALDDIEVHDLIASSPFNNFLCYYATGSKGRELGSSMLRLDMTSVRPDPTRPREEYRIQLSVLPLRLNVDQEAVEFFVQFFSPQPTPSSGTSTPPEQPHDLDPSDDTRLHSAQRDMHFLPLTPHRAELLAALTAYLKDGHILPASVSSAVEARAVAEKLLKQKVWTQHAIAEAIEYSDTTVSRWMHGQGDDTAGKAVMQLLSQLLPIALASATRALRGSDRDDDDDSDESDDDLSAGIGGAIIGAGGGRSPLRRMSNDPLESFQPFTVPAMPPDWIPTEFARQHAYLVPALAEAYNKYYDTCHTLMSHAVAHTIDPWRPTAATIALQPQESVSDYRNRILSVARAAARTKVKMLNATGVREVDNQLYVQSFQVVSTIILCIDWKPNTFDLKGLQNGDWAQLANLLPLENLQLDLKAVKLTGVTGLPRVAIELAKHWAYDLSRYQAHRYLQSVQPIRSIVNVGSGMADLVLLPISHYKHHGNLKRGMQRGLSSFLKNVSLESMTAAARLAQGAQTVLESVDEVLTFEPTPLPQHAQAQYTHQRARGGARRNRANHAGASTDALTGSATRRRPHTHISKQANAPASAQDGFRQAYESIARGLQTAATQLIAVPREEYQRYGSKGASIAVLHSVPSAALHLTISGLGAASSVLTGITNSIDPKRKRENTDKFKSGTNTA